MCVCVSFLFSHSFRLVYLLSVIDSLKSGNTVQDLLCMSNTQMNANNTDESSTGRERNRFDRHNFSFATLFSFDSVQFGFGSSKNNKKKIENTFRPSKSIAFYRHQTTHNSTNDERMSTMKEPRKKNDVDRAWKGKTKEEGKR